MHKKGFTLVELLGILVVLSIILVISVPAITSSLKRANQQKYDNWLKSLYIAAEEYTESHREDFSEINAGATSFLSIQLLLDQGYLKESVKDPESGRDITDVAIIKISVNSDKTLNYELVYKDELDAIIISVGIDPDPAIVDWATDGVTITIYAEASPGINVDQYSFDGGETWQDSNQKKFTSNQKVTVMARDSRINQQSEKKEVIINHIDSTAPTVANTIVNLVTTKSITVKAECQDNESGISAYQFSKDDGATWTERVSNSSYKFDNLTTGTYNLKVKCINGSGLKKESNKVAATTKDLIVPTCSINPTSGWTQNKTVTFTFPSSDENNRYIYSYNLLKGSGSADGKNIKVGEWTTTTNQNQSVQLTSADSSATASIIARVSDGVNTISGSSCTVTNVDGVAPNKPTVFLKVNSSTGDKYTEGSWTKENVYHSIDSSDVGSGIEKYQYSHDKEKWMDIPSSWPNYSLKDGKLSYVMNWQGDLNYYVRAVDKVGNASEPSRMFNIKIDKTKPTCTGGKQNTLDWGIIGKDSRNRIEGCSDNESGCTADTFTTNSVSDNVSVSATIYDKAGNTNTCSGDITNLEAQLQVTSHNCSIGTLGPSKCQLNFNTFSGLIIKHVYWQIYRDGNFQHQGGYAIWNTNYDGGLYYNGKHVRVGVYTISNQSLYLDCTSGYCNNTSVKNLYVSICSARNWNNCVDEFGPVYLY